MQFLKGNLPERIFFTGVPGSRWSGIAQELEDDRFDISDRNPSRMYVHHDYSGHLGVYYGTGMEFSPILDSNLLDMPYSGVGCKLHKSHEWSYVLPEITKLFPNDWVILIYRNDVDSFDWWKQAGGWNIKYPSYDYYVNDEGMQKHIKDMNKNILKFAQQKKLNWVQHNIHEDIFIAVYKVK